MRVVGDLTPADQHAGAVVAGLDVNSHRRRRPLQGEVLGGRGVLGLGDPACKGIGATPVALLVWDGGAHIGVGGDCRVYHQRAGKLTQVTKVQSIVARMGEPGQFTGEEAAEHPRRNEIYQAVGQRSCVLDLLLFPDETDD